MTVLITGNGHSGTTFVARLLMELGCDFGQGDPPAAWTQGAQAMEQPYVQRSAAALARFIEEKPLRDWWQQAAALLEEEHKVFPPYIKAPAIGWYLDAWLELGFQADAVIVCHRNIEDTLRSIERAGGGYGGFGTPTPERLYAQTGRLMACLWDHGIPHAVIPFPEVILQHPFRSLIYRKLYNAIPGRMPFTYPDLCQAHARLARPELVHFR